jgi:hypothetical protein
LRSGNIFVILFALGIPVAAGVAILFYSQHDFRLPPEAARSASALAGRCFWFRFKSTPEIRRLGWSRPDVEVRLERDSFPETSPKSRWFATTSDASDPVQRTRWRPAGSDSIDVVFPGWPIAVRARFPIAAAPVVGRALWSGDSGTEVVGIVDVEPSQCTLGAASKVPPNMDCCRRGA